jgi:hypothetical protein
MKKEDIRRETRWMRERREVMSAGRAMVAPERSSERMMETGLK